MSEILAHRTLGCFFFFGRIPEVSYYYVHAHTHSVPACRNAFLFIYSTYIRHAYTLSYYRKTYVEMQWTHLALGFH